MSDYPRIDRRTPGALAGLAVAVLAIGGCQSSSTPTDGAESTSTDGAESTSSASSAQSPSSAPPAPSSAASTAAPSQLPDGLPGGSIVFRRFDEEQSQAALFVMSSQGTGVRQITEPGAGEVDSLPDWAPDGTRIAFEREFPSKPWEIYVVNADGSGEHPVDPGCPAARPNASICEETAPDWSPDGRQLLFGWPYGKVTQDSNGEDFIDVVAVGVMDADGDNARQLTNLTTPTTYEDIEPVWSPDGARIAFVRLNITAEPVDATAVFVMNADGSGQRRITPWALRAIDLAWSPDGTALSFRSEPDPEADLVGDLYTVAPDGTDRTKITEHEPGTMTLGSSWSPDSRWIVFARSGVADLPDLYVMRRDGSELTPLTQTPVWDSAPTWSPTTG